jgi:hypothetical protein
MLSDQSCTFRGHTWHETRILEIPSVTYICQEQVLAVPTQTMSTIPTTEVVIFDTSEEFRKDVSILRPAFDIISKVDGVQACVCFSFW